MGEAAKLPFSLFTTKDVRPSEQFDAWHESISVIFDVAPLPEQKSTAGFAASVRGWHLGGLLVSAVDFEGQRFVRDRRKTVADGLDHYLVQLYATGGLVGEAGDRGRELRAGSPMGGLLTDYMQSLVARADDFTMADAPPVAEATVSMIAASFQPTAATTERARSAIEQTVLQRIQRHIAANLGSSNLHADALAALFRISRTHLYRLFERDGGVARYVQDQRLARACAELGNPAHDHRRIYEIAFALGFSSEAHFSRVFRATFGVSPSDVRAHAQAARVDGRRPASGIVTRLARTTRNGSATCACGLSVSLPPHALHGEAPRSSDR